MVDPANRKEPATTELPMPSASFATLRRPAARASADRPLPPDPPPPQARLAPPRLRGAGLIGGTGHGDGRHNRNFRMLGIHRMLPHAWRLGFVHPRTGVRVEVEAEPDAEFGAALRLFGLARGDDQRSCASVGKYTGPLLP